MKSLTEMLATHLRSKTLQIYKVFPKIHLFRQTFSQLISVLYRLIHGNDYLNVLLPAK